VHVSFVDGPVAHAGAYLRLIACACTGGCCGLFGTLGENGRYPGKSDSKNQNGEQCKNFPILFHDSFSNCYSFPAEALLPPAELFLFNCLKDTGEL
jgi:hypothetical protein